MASRTCRGLILVALILAAFASNSNATTIAQWTFETSVPTTAGPHAPEIGSGEAISFHASSSAAYGNPQGNGSAESFSADHWAVNDYWQFKTSTIGFEHIKFGWDQVSSGTGPRDFTVAWSIDGTNFSTPTSYVVLENISPNAWASTLRPNTVYSPVSAPADVDQQSAVYFRLTDTSTTSANGGTVNTSSGASRVDNVIISGDAVPEPTMLMPMASIALLASRRSRSRRSH